MNSVVGRSVFEEAAVILLHQLARHDVEAAEGLVENHHLGLVDERLGELGAPLHPARQLMRIFAGPNRRDRNAASSAAASLASLRPAGSRARASGPNMTFSTTLIHGQSAVSWKTSSRSGPAPLDRRAVDHDAAGVGREVAGGRMAPAWTCRSPTGP